MTAFYNEIDPYCAQWLRNLIDAGHIAPGIVSETSIEDLTPGELSGYAQVHLFAGIGIWSHALRLAGWPDDRPVWTGSCPCQPFSAAGQRAGTADKRHLWPAMHHHIRVCNPPVILGEQVASADGLGWLDSVQTDMEHEGYAFGAADLCAPGFRMDQAEQGEGWHVRQRLYWGAVRLADRQSAGPQGHGGAGGDTQGSEGPLGPTGAGGSVSRLGNPEGDRRVRWSYHSDTGRWKCSSGSPGEAGDRTEWLYCQDGLWRPTELGLFPLASEDPGRVDKLRAYGNSLDTATATGFIKAFMGAI